LTLCFVCRFWVFTMCYKEWDHKTVSAAHRNDGRQQQQQCEFAGAACIVSSATAAMPGQQCAWQSYHILLQHSQTVWSISPCSISICIVIIATVLCYSVLHKGGTHLGMPFLTHLYWGIWGSITAMRD
jgi:hypothetical protein